MRFDILMTNREKFPMVLEKAKFLTSALLKIGPEQSIDVDNAGMRLALDVVALVRKQKKYRTHYNSGSIICSSLIQGQKYRRFFLSMHVRQDLLLEYMLHSMQVLLE